MRSSTLLFIVIFSIIITNAVQFTQIEVLQQEIKDLQQITKELKDEQ